MKKLALLLACIMLSLTAAHAARLAPAQGRVIDPNGQGVEYATVVLLRDGRQVTGMATDTDGRFSLKVPAGDYTLSIQYLGYEPFKQEVHVAEESDLGDFVLRNAATQIESVVVKGQLIRREADRFVVDVANAPSAIGKDGVELLEHAPGIWIDNDKITINGKSGSKVYVNDRELRMEPERLLIYLRSLRAEEIQKIEVVPSTGADYDADSAGGVIKITLRKRRENGLDGSLSMRTDQSQIESEYTPSGNINVHAGRLDFYASAWANFADYQNFADEQTVYLAQSAGLISHSQIDSRYRNWGGSAGAVYELSDKHSIGAEFNYWSNRSKGPNDSYTDFTSGEVVTRSESRYDNRTDNRQYSATFNYIWKIDTLGSTLKLLADYTYQHNNAHNDNFTRTAVTGLMPSDSLYNDDALSRYQVTTATLAFDKVFSPRWTLRAGAKYTYNDMANDALYQYLKQDEWMTNENQSFRIDYTEHIAAAYAIASAKLKRWSIVAGLRGEYTHTYGKSGEVGQDYFSLFPNVNVSYSLTADGAYSIIGQYARTISRPRFWSLNPQRSQISDYTYQTGNPSLEPSYSNNISLTLVLKYKYTFTGGVTLKKDEIQQTMLTDPQDANILFIQWVNYDSTRDYYATVNLPFQLTKWWALNANFFYMRNGQRMEQHGDELFQNFWRARASTTFTLPAKFYIDLSYGYQNGMTLGNVRVEAMQRLDAGIKKQFGERFTLSFQANNLLNERQKVKAEGEGFVRNLQMRQPWMNRSYSIRFTYNFKSGKAFKRKAVEAGSAEEKSRL